MVDFHFHRVRTATSAYNQRKFWHGFPPISRVVIFLHRLLIWWRRSKWSALQALHSNKSNRLYQFQDQGVSSMGQHTTYYFCHSLKNQLLDTDRRRCTKSCSAKTNQILRWLTQTFSVTNLCTLPHDLQRFLDAAWLHLQVEQCVLLIWRVLPMLYPDTRSV